MKKYIPILFILVLFFPYSPLLGSNPEIAPDVSEKIIQSLRERYIPMYKKYQGVASDRQVEIKTYNSTSGELLHIAQVLSTRKDYFYKEPEVEIRRYIVDGKEEKPSKYKPLIYEPGYPVFDENGHKHYETRVCGYKIIRGRRCYEVDVVPKTATKLHYQGKLYYDMENLDLVFSSGGLGNLSFPLKGLRMDLYTEDLEDLTVVSTGVITAWVDLPVILPDRRIESRIKVLKNRPIL